MKYIILTILLTSDQLFAQQISLETGKLLSKFQYTNSKGQKLESLRPGTNTFLAIGFRKPTKYASKFYWTSGLSYNQYSASGSDTTYNNHYSWDANYLALSMGMDYEFLRLINQEEKRRGISVYFRLALSGEWLVQGTQTINQQTINLIGKEQFAEPFYFVRGGIGATYCVAKNLSLFAQYTGGGSLFKLRDQESLRIISHQFSIGLQISLMKCKYCYPSYY